MQYEKKDPYNVERHNNALDLNFTYVGADKYKLPKNWNGDDIVVDLSATGKEQFQILKSVCIQLVDLYKALEHGISYVEQTTDLRLPKQRT